MENYDFETSSNPTVEIVTIGGDLRLTGWDQPQFVAEPDDEDSLRLDRDGDHIVLHSEGDCTVRLPHGAQVSVQTVGGDAHVKFLEQKVHLGNVGGDLTLRELAGADVGQVGGDLSVKRIDGDLNVGSVGGKLEAKGISGAFSGGNIGDELYLLDVGGPVKANAGGDVTLGVNFKPSLEYSVNAGGDLSCRVGPDASARLTLLAGGDLRVDVKAAQVEGSGNRKTVTLGGGGASVNLRAGGDLKLTGQSFDPDTMDDFFESFGPMAEEFTAHFESQMEDFEKQMAELRAGMNYGPSQADVDKITAKARRAAEKIQHAAEQKAEAARRQAQREAEHAQRLAEAARRRAEAMQRRAQEPHGRRAWNFKFDPPRPPMPGRPAAAAPQSQPVSDEERMVILRMVEQGKITVADAEKLLAALENK